MSIGFSPEGPAFPEQLVDALLTGDVVFLCGAGISAPQLPGFSSLVKRCHEKLRVTEIPSEKSSCDAGRYEEVLGSISRRIVNPDCLTEVVEKLLRPPQKNPDLSQHHTILRLSRNSDNQPVIVTTNFDTLLEHALSKSLSAKEMRTLSSTGPALPQPGSANFKGIIHLHGRIADAKLHLQRTPLVLTSANYGDAYMYSGWASRFLFDLCRCKTLVLVGYSASDAPVRYFLNLLKEERKRFPDLRPVYALDARGEANSHWKALAVELIEYGFIDPTTEKETDHSPLWRDLDRLAELIERPSYTKRTRMQTILTKRQENTDETERALITWILKGQHDFWKIMIDTIDDASWFKFFDDSKLWKNEVAVWVIASWAGRGLQSPDRLNGAIVWLKRLGKPFATKLAWKVEKEKELPQLWLRAWRLLSMYPPEGRAEGSLPLRDAKSALSGSVVLYADLQKAVDLLTPVLEINTREPSTVPPERLNDLMAFEFKLPIPCADSATTLLKALLAVPQPAAIMDIATARLQAFIGLSCDIDAIDIYNTDLAVPSIAPHSQNDHRSNGPVFLVQLLAGLLPKITATDPSAARRLAEVWRKLPSLLGVRLWLHAQCNPDIYTADEAICGLQKLPIDIFWAPRPELALVLRDRATDATPSLVAQIEHRILDEADTYYAKKYEISHPQIDWHLDRDRGVWLRLNMLKAAGKLSETGATELTTIKQRHKHLDREIEDRDFFYLYSCGRQVADPDPQPFIDASDSDRLELARSVNSSPDIDKHGDWGAYCRTDPRGALDTLKQEFPNEDYAPLWNDLIASLSSLNGEHDSDIVRDIFSALESAPQAFLDLIGRRLVDLYWSTTLRAEPGIGNWWPRLFDIVVEDDTEPLNPRELCDRAIRSPSRLLTQAVLVDIENLQKSGQTIQQELLDAIDKVSTANGRQGIYARSALIECACLVVAIKAKQVIETLKKSLEQDNDEGIALRSVLVSCAKLTPVASKVFSSPILRGVKELDNKDRNAIWAVADKIIEPALCIVLKKKGASKWGIKITDTAESLRNGPAALREGTAQSLKRWIRHIDSDPAVAWRTGIHPLLEEIWPCERKLCEAGLARHFADLAINAGNAFPEAIDYLLPYMSTLGEFDHPHFLAGSEMPEKFPEKTLELLWRLFGTEGGGNLVHLPKILDRLIEACPTIEQDRRLQSLLQRAIRL